MPSSHSCSRNRLRCGCTHFLALQKTPAAAVWTKVCAAFSRFQFCIFCDPKNTAHVTYRWLEGLMYFAINYVDGLCSFPQLLIRFDYNFETTSCLGLLYKLDLCLLIAGELWAMKKTLVTQEISQIKEKIMSVLNCHVDWLINCYPV